MQNKSLETEWCLLQNQFDSYEKHSLYIKLMSVFALLLAEIFYLHVFLVLLILLVLWFQDSIWKTFQSRIESRILVLEEGIESGDEVAAFQFNSAFLKNRSGGASLIAEYLSQASRPTVAFPHAVLLVIALF